MKGDEIELRTDNVLTTADSQAVGPDQAAKLHEWPSDIPDTGGDPVTVCVMDSGIDQSAVDNHPWFEGTEVVEQFDATGNGVGNDEVGHGTACAGIYAKHIPKVELIDVRIFGGKGQTGWETIRKAYEWMVDHADQIDVANLSWGGSSNSPAINRHHDKLVSQGVYDVVAAGNTAERGGSPATAKSAFSVGAVDKDGDLTRFSSYNPNRDNPDVSALGKNVKLARAPGTSMGRVLDDQFIKASGTSFAAPYTGAAYGLALYAKPKDWDKAFEASAADIPGTAEEGEGVLQLASALSKGGESPTPSKKASVSVWSFAGNDVLYVNADWLDGDISEAELLTDEDGEKTVKFS